MGYFDFGTTVRKRDFESLQRTETSPDGQQSCVMRHKKTGDVFKIKMTITRDKDNSSLTKISKQVSDYYNKVYSVRSNPTRIYSNPTRIRLTPNCNLHSNPTRIYSNLLESTRIYSKIYSNTPPPSPSSSRTEDLSVLRHACSGRLEARKANYKNRLRTPNWRYGYSSQHATCNS